MPPAYKGLLGDKDVVTESIRHSGGSSKREARVARL
jgi:hypothetical protein